MAQYIYTFGGWLATLMPRRGGLLFSYHSQLVLILFGTWEFCHILLQESLQHPTSEGCVSPNKRQLFLDQEISDQQERHILHPVVYASINGVTILLLHAESS